jgi:isovaleryl-CoA dehydrogenase
VRERVEPQAAQYDRKEEFNLALFKELGPIGLLGITASDAHGGSAMDALAAVVVHEEISYSDPGFCLSYLAHSMLCVNNLSVNASETQKKKYLPKLCSGEWVGAMGMSEPHVGTDVLGMLTTAEKVGQHYRLNGRKMWITNGTIDDNGTPCDLVLVYARTSKSNEPVKISSFIVEKGHKGFSVGQKIRDKAGSLDLDVRA